MSGLLYGVGALAVVAGAVMVGFGISIDLSFGNTLIGAGVTAAIGGFIVIGLGVVVSQLQRLNDALTARAPIPSGRPHDLFDNAAGARPASAPARAPFPPKPRAELLETPVVEPQRETSAQTDIPAESLQVTPLSAPMLRNPEETPLTIEDDVSLSPAHPMATAARAPGFAPPSAPPRASEAAHPGGETPFEPKRDFAGRAPAPTPPSTWQPPTTHFDAMWPAEPKPAKGPAPVDSKLAGEDNAPASRRAEQETPAQRPASEPRNVAILKSGVVDGMGYTLYVDGSIEAELPQGTLRFSSINELRSHLEKSS